ncbi:MAG: endonuclease/exonuclease/phosphatase family protein [Pseudomonadota bacterium]
MRDILRGGDTEVETAVRLIAEAKPDILVLQSFDYDLHAHALTGFADALDQAAWSMPHVFARAPNTGVMTDVDLDGDGRTHGPRDAQGYGWFAGQGGMAVLSRFPIDAPNVRDHSSHIWAGLPWARLPKLSGEVAMTPAVQAVQRLSTTAHWQVPIQTPRGTLDIWTSHHTPPVFDGPEDRNGHRNADELRLWYRLLPAERGPFVLIGDFNLDPEKGDGQRAVMQDVLSHPVLQDPKPRDAAGRTDTAAFDRDIGDLRVSYVLPAACLMVTDSGLNWPVSLGDGGSRHALVWVDLRLSGRCQRAEG